MRIVFFYFALTLSASLFGQKPAEIVRANMALQQTAWNNGDIPGFMDHYWKHDSLKFIGSRGITYGWQRTLENYQKGYPDKAAMGELTFTLFEVTELSPAAVFVIGKWDLKKEKPAGGYFTLLWKKIKGKWVIVADHTS
jgi:ketosteroid isomerase-like protein